MQFVETKCNFVPFRVAFTFSFHKENVNEKISVIHYTKGEKKFIIGVKSSRKRWKVGDMRC